VPRAAFEVLDSAQQAVGLISDLLDLSRLDEDRLKPVIRAVDPEKVARRAIGRVTPAANARAVGIEVQAAAGLPTCETDAIRVVQYLVNLLGNPIQHTPEYSNVRVGVAAGGRTITYTVRDEGPGIPAAEVERIFDVYASNKAGDLRGVGLGLPLSRRLARLLGGDLHALSHPGEGGEFVLQLPATQYS
jgi:signal transduction histidine kinase